MRTIWVVTDEEYRMASVFQDRAKAEAMMEKKFPSEPLVEIERELWKRGDWLLSEWFVI